MLQVTIWVALAVAATAAIWKGSTWLEEASSSLASYYGLPAVVQGAIVVAIGSSFPELSSTVIATLVHGDFGLGVGAIVGSAIFNILVIPGLSGLYSRGVASNKDIAYKEAQFYMIAVSALVITFALGVIYNPVPGSGNILRGEITRWLALVPFGLYGVYIFTQYHDTADAKTSGLSRRRHDISVARQWGYLALSLAVIAIAVETLVKSAIHLGEFVGAPTFLMGVTVLAAGTSLPDALVSIRAAKDGNGVTSLANVFGSNSFDLLVAIPVGVLLAGTVTINFSMAVPMMGFLTLATLLTFVVLRTGHALDRRESVALLGTYVLFVAWMVFETVGLSNVLPAV